MTQGHMAQFMGHDTRHLALGMCRLNHAAVDVHWTTRQCKGIDVARVHNLKIILELGMSKLRWNRTDEPLSNARDIICDIRIAQNRQLLFYFGGCLPPNFDVICNFIFVAVKFDLRL